jgi:uncharacterized protein
MTTIKQMCEIGFGKIAGWSFTHHWLAILLVLIVNGLLLSQLPQLTIDTSNESFFHPDDQVLIDYNQFRDQFGKDEFIVLGLQHPNIFTIKFLSDLKRLHNAIESQVPYLDEVTSLVNIRNTRGEKDEVIVAEFLKDWPKNQTDLDILQLRALENSLYSNYVLSQDNSMTAVIIKPLACNPDAISSLQIEGSCQPMTNFQNREMMAAIVDILDKQQSPDIPIALSGLPAIVDYLNITLEKDLSIIIPMMLTIVVVFLGIMFRRISGVIYPIIIFLISLLSAMSIMAILGIPMSSITTILPSFILVVSISDSVHILALFYPQYQKTGGRKQAIIAAMEHSGLAVFMTTLTTAAGLLSFVAAEVAPVADLGIVAPIAVFLALFYTVLLLPALLAIFPVKQAKSPTKRLGIFNSASQKLALFSNSKQPLILCIFTVLFFISIAGINQLNFSHKLLNWFSESSPIRLDTELVDEKMRGSVSFDVIIDTKKADGLYDPAFIQKLEEATEKLENYNHKDLFVGKVISLTTVLKETNRALHENQQAFYTLPESAQLIAQELFLFQLSGSDDLEELIDQQFSKTRLTMHLPYRDSNQFEHFVHFVEQDLNQRFPDAAITVTGVNALFVEILNKVMATMLKSYTIALILISFLMIVMLGKLRMGLLSMIPNLFPIIMVMGLMGWFGIPLDLGTIMIGSISIGIIVDDTIHFLHNYGKYYDQLGDPEAATERTFNTVGRAMLVTSVVLIGGFLANLFSDLTINQNTGFLVAATVFIALLTDFILLPTLLSLVYSRRDVPIKICDEVTR